MTTIQIQNEVINYLNSGARADFFVVKNTKAVSVIELIDSPVASISQVVITVKYQRDGEALKVYTINQTAAPSFTWEILPADFSTVKPLNYWVEAVDQNQELLFYGSFTLN